MPSMDELDNAVVKQETLELGNRQHEARDQLGAPSPTPPAATRPFAYLHSLLLLSDSALPLGSFAYSAGLESYLAHLPKQALRTKGFLPFLELSLASIACTTLPYVIAGHKQPWRLEELDNDLDASTTCTVVRRASVKQGLALIAVWERSFRQQYQAQASRVADFAREALEAFAARLKSSNHTHSRSQSDTEAVNGHLPPLFGTLCATLTIPLPETLHLYLLNHVKTLLSAGVRASVVGPYQAQAILASENLTDRIFNIAQDVMNRDPAGTQDTDTKMGIPKCIEDAGQTVPMMDLWGGRHELLYSRIFNS